MFLCPCRLQGQLVITEEFSLRLIGKICDMFLILVSTKQKYRISSGYRRDATDVVIGYPFYMSISC